MPEEASSEPILERWSRLSLRAKGVAVLAVPILALFAAMLAIFLADGTMRSSDLALTAANETRAELLRLRLALLEAETGVSGFLTTGDTQQLSGYDKARSAAGTSLDRRAGDNAAERLVDWRDPQRRSRQNSGFWTSCATKRSRSPIVGG